MFIHGSAEKVLGGTPNAHPWISWGAVGGDPLMLTPGHDLALHLMPHEVQQPEQAVVGQHQAQPQQHVAQEPRQLQPVALPLLLRQPRPAWGRGDSVSGATWGPPSLLGAWGQHQWCHMGTSIPLGIMGTV